MVLRTCNILIFMNNSDETSHDKLPKIDYTKGLPPEIMDALDDQYYVIKKNAKLSWDGRQFIVRIPSEIISEYGVTRENRNDYRLRFDLKKPNPKSDKELELKVELVKWS